jgi:hypothetical protein
MGLRDEITAKSDKIVALETWISKRKNADEWREVILDRKYSARSVVVLLKKHGFTTDPNVVHRFRQRHAAI